ncbi:MAG: hypothetical protein WBH89_02380, partial [Bacteroidaceae bacterium]
LNMKKGILIILMSVCAVWASAQEEETMPKLNKMNMVVKEWNTDVKTNKKFMDRVTTYNSDGKKIDEIEYNISGQKWRKRYEYDQNGMVFREFVYNEKNVLDNYKRFEYNEFGKKKTQYTYDAKGKLKTIKVFEYITQDAGK